jgi:hypothetical protein
VDDQQRDLAVGGSVLDQLEVLADGVVVVVAVEDHGIRKLDMAKRLVAALIQELELRVLVRELHELALRVWIDRRDPCIPARTPGEQLAGQAAGERADLRNGPRPCRIEARKHDLRQVGERITELLRVDLVVRRVHAGDRAYSVH